MAIPINIDFDNVYDIDPLSDDLKISEFSTELQDDQVVPLRIEISNEPHELLPDVYNLQQ